MARGIQDESDVPFVYWGIDTLFDLVPPNWGGGRDGPLSRAGFWYDRTGRDVDGHPLLAVRYGEVGHRMLRSACTAAAAFAHGGDHPVIDEMLLTPDLLPIWLTALAGLDVQLVAVTCPLHVAEQREPARGNEPALARGHFHSVHAYTPPLVALPTRNPHSLLGFAPALGAQRECGSREGVRIRCSSEQFAV